MSGSIKGRHTSSPVHMLFFRNRFRSILSIGLFFGRLCTWSESAGKSTSEIEPPRPLPSIGLSNLGVRKRFELRFRFSIDFNGKSRTKPRMASEIRRVTDAWNTPARLVSFPTVRYVYKTSAYSKRFETNSRYTNHEIPATSGFRFNTEVYVDLDQGCDRRVESDINTDSY